MSLSFNNPGLREVTTSMDRQMGIRMFEDPSLNQALRDMGFEMLSDRNGDDSIFNSANRGSAGGGTNLEEARSILKECSRQNQARIAELTGEDDSNGSGLLNGLFGGLGSVVDGIFGGAGTAIGGILGGIGDIFGGIGESLFGSDDSEHNSQPLTAEQKQAIIEKKLAAAGENETSEA